MPTPHIDAEKGDFAEAVLLPGDPLRAKFIADKYLEDAHEVTSVRNMLGFTGSYAGMPVSVMVGSALPTLTIGSSAFNAARRATCVVLESIEPIIAHTRST